METVCDTPDVYALDDLQDFENGERRLLLAIITRAIDDVSPGLLPSSRRNGSWKRKRAKPTPEQIDARAWLLDNSDRLLSFVWVCDALGFADTFRARIRSVAREKFHWAHQTHFTFF